MTTVASGPPLVTRPFLLLTATGLAFFTAGGMVLPAASPYAIEILSADAVGAGIAVGAFALAALAMRPVVGWASDRYGRRPLLIGGALLTVIALLAHLAASTLPAFVVVRGAFGIAEAFFFVSVLAAASDLAPPERRGEALNLVSLSLYLGLAFGPPLGEVALGAGGYAAVWIVAAVLAGVAVALAVPLPETAPAAVSGAGERVRTRLIHPAAVFPGLLVGCGAFGMAGFLAFIPLYAREIGLDGAAIPLAVYALIVVGLRLAFAKLPDQVGAARLSGGRSRSRRSASSSRWCCGARSGSSLARRSTRPASRSRFRRCCRWQSRASPRRSGERPWGRRACSSTHRSGSRRLCSAASRCRGGSAAPSSWVP